MAGYYAGRKLYRSRDGAILGVCKGIAEWRDFPVDMVRLVWILATIFIGGFPGVLIYLILAFILPVEPEGYYREREYRNRRSYQERKDDLKADFENLKSRVNWMEDEELDKERDWDNRFSKGK